MAQTLETIIAINATVGNGFSEIGSTLTQLGAQIDGISEKLIGFGKDSLKTYEDYEKNMAEARGALATKYGRDTQELDNVMKQLDTQAREWASSTIFHTDDVGNAITEAARAGWDLEKILTGIPAAMELAQAGSIDLSDAVYYITEAAKAGQIEFGDLAEFIDMWSYAANNSNGTIESFGDTMLRLGSVMNFAGSREELLALIAVMHETGTEGSTAATLLRTAMMNILAPSGTAGKVLEQLGATEEEIESVRQDASKLQALTILGEHGFSAFDDQGQAKNILTIFHDLREALADIAGGYDLIDKNETSLGVLGTIFGKRGITGALNIMNMLEYATGLEKDLIGGAAEGYGSYLSGTMMDTLYGRIETWESKVENLKLRTGDTLAEQLKPVLEAAGGIADSLATLDTGTFNALVAGLEVIAAAGPGLMLAGGAFRLIGYALTPAGGIGLGLIALTAAAAAINELEKADFADKFGNLELDSSEIQSYVTTLGNEFKEAYTNVDEFKRALSEAVEQYTTTSSTFKSNIITDMLTGVEIKEGSEEYTKLVNMGETMASAVRTGIDNNYAALMESITQSFGGDAENIDDPIWAQIISVIEQGYSAEIGRAADLSQQLRDAMTSAFQDGHLTAEEVANIQSIIDEQNALLAKQQDREHFLERQRILRKAQTLGLEAIREASEQVEAERDAEWEALQDRQAGDYYDTAAWYDKAIENGWMVPNTDGTEGEHAATQADKTAALAELSQRQEDERYRWGANFSDYLMGVWTEGISSSELSGTWDALQQLGKDFREAGGIITQDAANRYAEGMGTPRESLQAQQYLQEMVAALGGYDVLQGYADYFMSQGNTEMAQRYQNIMDIYDAMGRVAHVDAQVGTQGQGDYSEVTGTYEQIAALLRGAYGSETSVTPEVLADYMAEQRGMGMEPDWKTYMGDELWSQFNAAAQASGTTISEMIANAVPGAQSFSEWNTQDEINRTAAEIEQMRGRIANINENGLWQNVTGNTAYRVSEEREQAEVQKIEADIVVRQNELAELYAGNGLEIPVTPYVEGTDAVESLRDQGVQVEVDGDTQQLQATIDGVDGQTLMEYVSGDATNLSMTISDQDGKTLRENVTGDASSLASVINSYNGKTITVNIRGNKMFASGGRATEASTFGEAGPEWAIPEEHSQRTAELLNAARAASGFTWPEIISRYGGLNANPNNVPATLVYSPTIYAQDAEGVEDKLMEDKARLDKWYREKNMMDEMEVYA